ncbi:MAG: sigma-70 family RNA polymerase sigma factor, partial [Propionibacteriaceae bacterium]|nr:sigma-70 family RNA polymerase sigma factor [Propionibacteriaceae bacterium]
FGLLRGTAPRNAGGPDVALGERFPDVLSAAAEGADWAWAELYDEFAPSLLRFITSQGAADPEDCLGECFVQLVRNLPSFSGDEAAFRAWLFRVARNRVVDAWRAAHRRPVVLTDDVTVVLDTRHHQEPADAELTVRYSVEDVLATLGEDQRAVIVLRVLDQFGVEEVAVILDRSPGAIRALQHRAVRSLREALGTPVSGGRSSTPG